MGRGGSVSDNGELSDVIVGADDCEGWGGREEAEVGPVVPCV